jgi:hypothetical protein
MGMPSRSTAIIAVVVIAVFLGGLYIATTVPLFNTSEVIVKRGSDILSAGHFLALPIKLDKGSVDFSYSVTGQIDAFIMTEEQYNGFSEIFGFVGSEAAALGDNWSGSLAYDIKKGGTYYFIILNKHDRLMEIRSIIIEHTEKKTLLESLRID